MSTPNKKNIVPLPLKRGRNKFVRDKNVKKFSQLCKNALMKLIDAGTLEFVMQN